MTLVRSGICRHENIKVILDVQLWELRTQRLRQGLSETILVNTLTDVREFKKSIDDHPFQSRMVRYAVGKGDIIFPSKGEDR